MSIKQLMAVACAAGLAFGAFAEEAKASEAEKEEKEGVSFTPGEGISFGEMQIVTAEFGLAFDSKFMSYGLVDNKDPIITPSAGITFFDWVCFEVEALFDVTKYGKKAGYGNRASRYMELDPGVSLVHSFSPDDYEWLPTTVEFSLGYSYEYHPRSMGGGTGEPGDDTQFVTFEVGLPDLWVEPTFSYERDIDRDNGTYLNLELGHTFPLIDGEGDGDPLLALRPSIAQGFGNTQRVAGYLVKHHTEDEALDHGGLMDTCAKLELTWNICDCLSLSGYVAYYDYIFDEEMRDAARDYEATGRDDTSWHFVGGVALTATF